VMGVGCCFLSRLGGSSNASIVQPVAVLMVNLRPIRTEVFAASELAHLQSMQPRRTPAFHFYLRTSDVFLLCENLFGIPGIREPSRFDALGR